MQIALCFSFVLIGNAFQVKKACKILHLQGVMIRAAEPEPDILPGARAGAQIKI